MNAKQAKRLRRQARELSPSEGVNYSGVPHARTVMATNRKTGEPQQVVLRSNQAVVSSCERATYKALKKLASPA